MSDSIKELKFILPGPQEYREDMPLPSFLDKEQRDAIQETKRAKTGRADSDQVTEAEYDKLDKMVFFKIHVFRIPVHVFKYVFRGLLVNICVIN